MASRDRSKSSRDETLELVLVFGQKKLPLLVSSVGSIRPGRGLTIGHLSDAVTEVAQVEASRQKLIYRGRTLFKNDPESMKESFETSLSSLGIKMGERIMLLGRKASEMKDSASHSDTKDKSPVNADSPPLDKLGELRAKLDNISGRLEREAASANSTQGLPDLKKCRLNLRGLHEEMMRLLETVDSTTAPPGNEPDFRSQRKALVNALQGKLDELESHLSNNSKQIRRMEDQNS